MPSCVVPSENTQEIRVKRIEAQSKGEGERQGFEFALRETFCVGGAVFG